MAVGKHSTFPIWFCGKSSLLDFWSISAKRIRFANSTQCSQAVTHPSTDWAQCCLTSVIGRELVCSAWYGRWRKSRVKLETLFLFWAWINLEPWNMADLFAKWLKYQTVVRIGLGVCRFRSLEVIIGEVSRALRYCNTRPTLDRTGASSCVPSPGKNQFNIEEGTWPSYQILSW